MKTLLYRRGVKASKKEAGRGEFKPAQREATEEDPVFPSLPLFLEVSQAI